MTINMGGQNIIPEKFKNKYFKVMYLQMSSDRKYVSFTKNYQQSMDTVALVNTQNRDSILLDFPKTISSSFTKSGNFFVKTAMSAELVLLPSVKKIKWKDVQGAEFSKEFNLLAILKNHLLQILDDQGNVVRTIANVRTIFNREGNIYYLKQNESEYQLYVLEGKSDNLIFKSKYEKIDLFKLSSCSYLVLELVDNQYQIYFSDVSKKFQVKFENSSISDVSGFMQKPVITGKNQVFLNLIVKTVPKNKSAVEVWYGNDNYIVEHTYDNRGNVFALWDPYENNSKKLESSQSTRFFHNGNSKYLLTFDPLKHRDYTKKLPPFTLYRFDPETYKEELLSETGSVVYCDPTGTYLTTFKNGYWWLININTKIEVKIPLTSSRAAYFSDNGKILLFENENELTEYHTESGKLNHLKIPAGYRSRIISDNYVPISPGSNINRTNFNHQEKLYVELWNRSNNKTAIASYFKGKLDIILPPTENYIGDFEINNQNSNILYTLSNIDMPPQIWIKNKKPSLAYDSKSQDKNAKKIKSEKITTYNSKGKEITGVLIYPLDFNPTQKYPMITLIYESQVFESNKYLIDGLSGSTEGVNSRDLIENGYFVFLPSVVYDERGTGFSALDCVNAQLDALKKNTNIDFSRVALVGHSHGGYETNFIATQSDRFATYIAGAGNSDLVRSFHSFNYNFKSPFFWQYEDGQYRMPGKFSIFKDLYIENSPTYNAEKVSKPILLWAGKKDENIVWDQSMEFYLALRRNNKKVTALFYPEDGHTINEIENRVDLYTRISDWLDYHLKDIKKDWIQKMNN